MSMQFILCHDSMSVKNPKVILHTVHQYGFHGMAHYFTASEIISKRTFTRHKIYSIERSLQNEI